MIISLAGLDMYALAYVESRYIGAFVVLLLANLLSNIHRPDLPVPKMLLNFVSAIMLLVMAINIVAFNVEGFIKLTDAAPSIQPPSQQTRPPSCPGKVAEALNRSGIQPGDQVAIIGYGYDAFWARLARVKIVAEMLEWQADDCCSGDSALQARVLQALVCTGAKSIVAENVPGYASLVGWHMAGNSNYYFYLLTPWSGQIKC